MTVLDKWCFSLRCSSVLTVRQPDVLRRFHVDLLGDIFCPDTRAFQRDLSTSEQIKSLQLFCYSFCQVCSERETTERSQRPHTDDKTPESLCARSRHRHSANLSVKPQIVCVASLMCATQQREQTSAWTFRRWKWVRVVLQSFLICQADRTPFLTMHPIVLSEWFERQAFNVANISYRKCGPPLNLS